MDKLNFVRWSFMKLNERVRSGLTNLNQSEISTEDDTCSSRPKEAVTHKNIQKNHKIDMKLIEIPKILNEWKLCAKLTICTHQSPLDSQTMESTRLTEYKVWKDAIDNIIIMSSHRYSGMRNVHIPNIHWLASKGARLSIAIIT